MTILSSSIKFVIFICWLCLILAVGASLAKSVYINLYIDIEHDYGGHVVRLFGLMFAGAIWAFILWISE